MSLPTRAVLKGAQRRGQNWIGPRLLLLFSCLMVMMASLEGNDHAALRVGVLLLAASSAGLALFRPMVVGDPDRLRRAEWALVLSLLLAGITLTTRAFALGFADWALPLRLMLLTAYMILGLIGSLLLVRRRPNLKWAFPLFLLVHCALAVAFLRASPVGIDVYVFLHDAAGALLSGVNPYSMTFPNIYPPATAELFYGPGVVADGRVTYGFPYLPVSLLAAIPGHLLGDVRYSQLIAMLVTALAMHRLAPDRVGRAIAVLGVAAASAITVLHLAWTEPTVVALLACLVLALDRRRFALAAVFLGLFMVSKQYVVTAIPLIWLIRQRMPRGMILLSFVLAAAVTLPFFLINPAAFWKAIVEFQLIQPFRADSVSLLVSSVNSFGWPAPWTYGILPLAGGGLTALALALRAPRTPAAFAGSVGLALLVMILLSKQAFMNYYFLVNGAFLIAAAAWPQQPESAIKQTD